MKRLCLIVCLLLCLTGCGAKEKKAEVTAPASTSVPLTPAPTPGPTAEPTPSPAPVTAAPVAFSVKMEAAATATPLYTPTPSPVPSYQIGGATVSADATSLVLSDESELSLLDRLPCLKEADCSAFVLDIDTAYRAMKSRPEVSFKFTLEVFGQTVTSDTELLDLKGTKIQSLALVEETVQCMPNIKKIDMCGCGFSDAEMGTLFDKYPDVRFVWELNLKGRKLRTDAVGFTTANPGKYTNANSSESYKKAVKAANPKRLYTEDLQVLRYCPDLVALDLGHNYIDDLSVLEYLPKLQILIVADNKFTDIFVFEKLPELVYVEFFMNAVTDITPLANHEHLLDLNFCNNKVEDISPLLTMPQLERVWCAGNKFSRAEGKAMQEQLPDCIVDYTAKDDTADGWREHERYDWMRAYVKGEHDPA